MISPLNYAPTTLGLEPVYNILNSMALLTNSARDMRPNAWAARAISGLTQGQRALNTLLFEGFGPALLGEGDWQSFPSFLDALADQRPTQLRDDLLARLCKLDEAGGQRAAALLADREAFLERVEELSRHAPPNQPLQHEVHRLLNSPGELHDLLLQHLVAMWEQVLEGEWQRAQRALQQQLRVLAQAVPAEAAAADIFRRLTGRELPAEVYVQPAEIERIILVPSPHLGRGVSFWLSGRTLRLFFSAPPNYGVLLRTSPIGFNELRVRCAALADETRLRILDLLAQHDDLPAQELIAHLGLSQSSVSRHLKQLVNAGYLFEQRGDGANKIYSLSTLNLDGTIRALGQLIAGEGIPTEQPRVEEIAGLEFDEPVRHLLDPQGRVKKWPRKEKDKQVIFAYLAGIFELGRRYTEKEVNELIKSRIAFSDYVTVRRYLYDYRYLNRERDGSAYWREASAG